MRVALLFLPLLLTTVGFGKLARFDSNVTTAASNVPSGASENVITMPVPSSQSAALLGSDRLAPIRFRCFRTAPERFHQQSSTS